MITVKSSNIEVNNGIPNELHVCLVGSDRELNAALKDILVFTEDKNSEGEDDGS